jgi:hypothetical protein
MDSSEFARTDRCDYYTTLLESKYFTPFPVKRYDSETFNVEDVKLSGIDFPFIVHGTHTNFGIELPDRKTTLKDIARIVEKEGPVTVRVIEVGTQSEVPDFNIGKYADYLETCRASSEFAKKSKILNMISFEFSRTNYGDAVQAPTFVNQLDWVTQCWPLEKSERDEKPYVQKYCLAGMAGSYTDFHIDFGGTSVWYHILWGKKRFFLIPPTTKNLQAYENWTCSNDQANIFLGDQLDGECFYLDLLPNETLIIPSGWIHSVYTPDDSLVFGGNFLHSYSIIRQLQSFKIESRTHVNDLYQFPFFREINFCYLISFYQKIKESSEWINRLSSSDGGYTCSYTDFTNDPLLQNQLLQFPLLLKACDVWLHDKKYEAILCILAENHFQIDSIDEMINDLWSLYENSAFLLTGSNGYTWKDFQAHTRNGTDWEGKICEKLYSQDMKNLLDNYKPKSLSPPKMSMMMKSSRSSSRADAKLYHQECGAIPLKDEDSDSDYHEERNQTPKKRKSSQIKLEKLKKNKVFSDSDSDTPSKTRTAVEIKKPVNVIPVGKAKGVREHLWKVCNSNKR